jgi:hypothetical protein
MTRRRLPVAFDDCHEDSGDRLHVTLASGSRDRPVWSYWFPLLCQLFPASMRPLPAAIAAAAGTPFVYPIELRFEADEWCAGAPADTLIAVLPPAVAGACAAGRVVVVFSIAHEGRPLDTSRYGLLDRLDAFGQHYRLPAERLWFVTGNLDAGAEISAWFTARGRSTAPFTIRCCELFSAFFGGCTRESVTAGRAPRVEVSFERQDEHTIGWRTTTVRWTPAPFSGLRTAPVAAPRWQYACLNRMFRQHRWDVLVGLHAAGVLDRGLVSFGRPTAAELRAAGVDPDAAAVRELLDLLPLTIDRDVRYDDQHFFADNAYFVAAHPTAVLRECAMELVTETRQDGPTFVSEKSFKALLGRGPAVVVGPRGALSYLRSIGVHTWPHAVDETYDGITNDGQRLAAAMDTALNAIGRERTDGHVTHSIREANTRWLVEAPKPWDALTRELHDAVMAS